MPSPAEPPLAPPPGVSPTFWELLLAEDLGDKAVVDVGTGTGRLALALARLCRRVVGVDHDVDAIAEARRRAGAAGLDNAEFVVADVEEPASDFVVLDPAHIHPDLVAAHLYLSDELIEGASTSLSAGGALAFVGFHADQWKESGRSRFAYDEDRVRDLLVECGFVVEHLTVEREVKQFASFDEALAATADLERRWREGGRWARWLAFLQAGGRTLTRSHLVVKARRT